MMQDPLKTQDPLKKSCRFFFSDQRLHFSESNMHAVELGGPTADRDEPHRANWRRLKELPMWAMFRTLSDEPKRARPRTVIVLEIRAKFRKLNELPRWRKSSTDTPLPKRAIPKILAALDIRAKHRRLRELPRWRKSRTESA